MARKTVVVIRSMKAYNDAIPFGQGNVVCVIPDARDIGVQLYANDCGSAFFTLPVDHFSLPLIQPLKQHYVIQKWDGSAYVTVQSGIITDYDASSNEVVITGVDYMTALNKYYTPLHGPELGAKAIPNTDTTTILSTTPKLIIEAAIARDRAKASESYAVSATNSSYANVGKIAVFSGSAASAAIPTGTRDAVTVTYEEVGGVKTGTVILSGAIFIWRSSAANSFQDGETGEIIEGNFSIGTASSPSSSLGRIGLVVTASPGGPLVGTYIADYIAASNVDIGFLGSGYGQLNFSIKLRPVSNYTSGTEDHSGTDSTTKIKRTYSILSEGVTYEFYVTPYYIGNLSPAATTADPSGTGNVDYNQTIWGQPSRAPESTFTAGLQSNTVNVAISELFDTTNPANILDRENDFPSISPTPVPLIKFTTLNQINTSASSANKHPYITAGQGPVDFMRELADTEMGSREDGSKIIFNYYGVPGGASDGRELIVNHSVSSSPQYTLVYPGNIIDFNATSRLSGKVNSARVIPTTDFLIGSSTEGAGGAKTKGVVRNPAITTGDPALPSVISQSGFLSATSAGNFAKGIINDYGTDADVQDIKVRLRTETFGPIGMTGTPKLGEAVKVVINRKAVTIGGDTISGTYNVNGMQWTAKVDGTESLTLDLIKPNKFKGPVVTWERKPAPTPAPADTPYVGRKPTTKKHYDASGNEMEAPDSPNAPTGTSFMWAGTTGGKPPAVPKTTRTPSGNKVGLPRIGSTKRTAL
jgi:hypothetical protein